MPDVVLDSWPVLALLKDQNPAAGRVRELLQGDTRAVMNILNVGEVFYLVVKKESLAYGERVLQGLRDGVTMVAATDELVLFAALLKARHAISYADAFAAATAIRRKAPLVTGDDELRRMAAKEPALQLIWVGEG